VAEITRLDSGPGWSLHAKPGWQNAPFALNIAMAGAAAKGACPFAMKPPA
jgi:hypothetical protein